LLEGVSTFSKSVLEDFMSGPQFGRQWGSGPVAENGKLGARTGDVQTHLWHFSLLILPMDNYV
jgi:hypothetical protein